MTPFMDDQIERRYGAGHYCWRTDEDGAGQVTVAASASADTKGSWVELLAASSFDFRVGLISIEGSGTGAFSTDTGQLLDIGIGGAGSEQVVIANIPTGWSALQSKPLRIPLSLPPGVRIAARLQASTGSDDVDIGLELFERGGAPVYERCETIGADTANSCGTTVESSSWVELSSGIAYPVKAIIPVFDFGAGGTFGGDSSEFDIGVGASSSEVQVYPSDGESFGLVMTTNSGEIVQSWEPRMGALPTQLEIPAGTRIAARRPTGARDSGLVLLGLS